MEILNGYFCGVKILLSIRQVILLVLLLFPITLLQAKSPGLQISASASAKYRFSSDSSSEFFFNYEILKELAREQLVEVPYVKLGFEADVLISVDPDEEGQSRISIQMKNKRATGNTFYRGFDVAAFLVPVSGTIELIHADRSDPALARSYLFSSADISSSVTDLPSFLINRFDPVTDTLTIRITSLRFDASGLERLRERIGLINDYYASVSLLDSAIVRAGRIRTDTLPLLPYSLADIMEVARVTDLVFARNFDSTLFTGGPDPKDLKVKRQEALRRSKTLEYNLLDRLDKSTYVPPAPSPLPPALSIDSLAAYFVNGMIRYIRLSTLMSDISGNIYADYLDRYYSVSSFPDEKATVQSLLEKIYPDAAKDTLLSYVSAKIYQAYKTKARQLIVMNAYADAVALVRHARLFKQKNPYLEQGNGTEELLSEAARGVYTSYLGIAATSISYEKFGMAEVYLQKALEYKRTNEAWFSTDTLYGSVFMKLFRTRLAHCDRMVEQQDYRNAVDCYHSFESSFDPELVAMVSPWIMAKTDTAWSLLFDSQEKQVRRYMKEEMYDSLFLAFRDFSVTYSYLDIDTAEERRFENVKKSVLPLKYRISADKAVMYAEARDYPSAWNYYLEADSAAAEAGIPHDSAFCALQVDLFRWHTAEELSYRTGYIWSDQFDSAWIYLASVNEKIETMGLSNDTALAGAMEKYRQKILRKQCMNLSEEADILVLRASRNAEQGRYAPAYRQFSEALAKAEERPECGLKYPSLADSVLKYRAPSAYQDMADTLQLYYVVGNYARVFRTVSQMEKDFTAHGLSRFGLTPVTTERFVTGRNDRSLTMAAVEMMIVNARPDDALAYLRLLERFGTPAEDCSRVQETVGKMLARRDIGTGVIADCKQNLAFYANNDKWFKVLAKAYCGAFEK